MNPTLLYVLAGYGAVFAMIHAARLCGVTFTRWRKRKLSLPRRLILENTTLEARRSDLPDDFWKLPTR